MKKEPLDMLFTNFSSTAPSYKETPWDEFEVRLQKKMFYKFSWNRFNIYYVTLISLSILANIVLVVFLASNSSPNNSVQQVQIFSSDTSTGKNYLPALAPQQVTSTSLKNYPLAKTTLANKFKDSVSVKVSQNNTDTLNTKMTVVEKSIINPAVPAAANAVVVKRKSTMYISKRDTIINVDTVKVKRKK